jgi:uncharacterized protein YqjF (DUF2071 family)
MWNELLDHDEHRPYPLPDGPWVMHMRWSELLFAHWPVPVEAIRPLVVPGLEIDTFDGTAWFTVTPLSMSSVSLRFVPNLPGVSAFPELNVRTYVKAEGKPGIWFFSLDAADVLAVIGARMTDHLPYARALMTMETVEDLTTITSKRRDRFFPPAAFRAVYRPTDKPQNAAGGTLDEWLIERYCLYAADRAGTTFRGEIHHLAWPVQHAEAAILENTMHDAAGVRLPNIEPVYRYASRLDVLAWPPERIS